MATEDATAAEAGDTLAGLYGGDLERFREAIEKSYSAIVITDAAGIIEYVNPSFEELTGQTAGDLIGRHTSVLGEPGEVDETIWEALSAGNGWRGEIKRKRPDGEEYWALASIQPLRSDNGEITHFMGVNVDITERVKAEEELAEREAYWRALVENAPDHIMTVAEDGVITSLNRSVAGIAVDDIVGRTVYDFVREEYQDAWRGALAEVFAGGQRVEFEVRTFDVPGETQSYAIRISAVCEGDTVVAGIASIRNVTTLKEAEERMRAIATAVSDIIVVIDEEGLLIELLAPTQRQGLLLLPPEELRGMRVQEFLPKEQVKWTLEFVRATVADGKPRSGEVKVDLPQGPTWLSCRSAPLTLADGRVAAVVHILDISERKRLEAELQSLREETEARAEEGVKRASQYGLTFREVTVLSLIARGKSDKEIAALLGLSRYTVNKHSSNLVRKLGASSRSQAAARAVRESII